MNSKEGCGSGREVEKYLGAKRGRGSRGDSIPDRGVQMMGERTDSKDGSRVNFFPLCHFYSISALGRKNLCWVFYLQTLTVFIYFSMISQEQDLA